MCGCGGVADLCGTPGYLAPEVLRVSMYDNADGYGRPVDMLVSLHTHMYMYMYIYLYIHIVCHAVVIALYLLCQLSCKTHL